MDEAKERERFEAEMRLDSLQRGKDIEGNYRVASSEYKWDGWLAAKRDAEDETARLRKFAHWCISELMLDVEGVQDMGVECGLIVPTEVSEPCGEGCRRKQG